MQRNASDGKLYYVIKENQGNILVHGIVVRSCRHRRLPQDSTSIFMSTDSSGLFQGPLVALQPAVL